jgi:hypothetical protein
MFEKYNFPRTLSIEEWREYLRRDIHTEERVIIEEVKMEYKFNSKVKLLHDVVNSKGLYISKLTNLYGNCLFESLVEHKMCNCEDDLRKALAYIMYVYQDYPNFFPNQQLTLKELFNVTNEVEYVLCRDDRKSINYYVIIISF